MKIIRTSTGKGVAAQVFAVKSQQVPAVTDIEKVVEETTNPKCASCANLKCPHSGAFMKLMMGGR